MFETSYRGENLEVAFDLLTISAGSSRSEGAREEG